MWREDFVAIPLPPGDPIDVVLEQPLLVGPPAPAVGPDELEPSPGRGRRRDRSALTGRASRIPASFAFLAPPNPIRAANNSACARLVITTLCSPVACRYRLRDHAELQQHLLHVDGQLPAAGRIRHLNRVARQGRARAVTLEQRLQKDALDRGRRLPQPVRNDLSADRWPHISPSLRRRQRRQVVDVEFEQPRARRDRAFGDIPRSTDDRVVGGNDHLEVVAVEVVESGPRFGHEALADECPGQKRFHRVGTIRRDRTRLAAVRCNDHVVVWAYLFDQLPQQRRHAGHVHQTQQRMVRRAGDVVTLGGRHGEGLVVTRVEDSIRDHRISMPVKDFQLDRVVRVRSCSGHDPIDPHRLAQRQAHQRRRR